MEFRPDGSDVDSPDVRDAERQQDPPVDRYTDLRVDDAHLGLDDDDRPRHLSPSSAGLYEQCPRKWRFRYVDRLPDPPGVPALVGTFAHLVLEHLLQLPSGERSRDQARELARELWPHFETETDYVALSLDDDASRGFRWKAWQAVEGLWTLEDPDETIVHATEQEVQVAIGDVPFRGIIDRVDVVREQLVVTDYKSGKAPADRFRQRPLKQVMFYAAAIAELTGVAPLGARLHYLGQRTLSIKVTDHNLGTARSDLARTWQSLTADADADQFATTTGPLCAWCPFLGACEDGQHEVIERHREGRVRQDAPGVALVTAAAG